jgi:hypothetical protein
MPTACGRVAVAVHLVVRVRCAAVTAGPDESYGLLWPDEGLLAHLEVAGVDAGGVVEVEVDGPPYLILISSR